MMKLSVSLEPYIQEINPPISPSLRWNKLSETQKTDYHQKLSELLRERPSQMRDCGSQCLCTNPVCHAGIQEEYDALLKTLKEADCVLPRFKPGVQKDWWTPDLTILRDQSVEAHALWVAGGRQHAGPLHLERIRARATFKRAVRAAQRNKKQESRNRLHEAFVSNDTDSFWKNWRHLYSKDKSNLSPMVDGCVSQKDIAGIFKSNFQKNAQPNDETKVNELGEEFSKLYDEFSSNHAENCDCTKYRFTVENILDATFSMKKDKCADDDGISAEHFFNAPLALFDRLKNLFNHMLFHSFVPFQFRLGFVLPIVKDNQGSLSDSGNYRGITISPIQSKIFEHALKIVFASHLTTSLHQFGFKKRSSTTHALYCLKETINYFVNNGSRVFCSFLDASKAFDRLVHAGLYIKLIKRGTPKIFVDIIMAWYQNLQCRVKWGDATSEWFQTVAGVRQGGVLSPDFYNIYVEDLLAKLKSLGIGCYVLNQFAAALFYADDMALLSPTLRGLQRLLDCCSEYCRKWDIGLNPKKTKNMYFGRRVKDLHCTSLDGKDIEWVDKWTYLGVSLKSAKNFNCSISEKILKFYKCANAIFRIDGQSDELTMLRLIEAHCIPLLTYAIEVIHVTDPDEWRKMRVAYNSVFRKIFGYGYFDSVRELQGFLGRPTWEELIDKRKTSFKHKLGHFPIESIIHQFPNV